MAKPSKPILVVEDEGDLGLLIGQCLESKGYAFRLAVDGAQAMTFAHQAPPPLVVLDFMFPSGGGAAVHKAFRASTYGQRTPILLLSSVPEEDIAKTTDMDGDTYYITKPFERVFFLDVVEQILGVESRA